MTGGLGYALSRISAPPPSSGAAPPWWVKLLEIAIDTAQPLGT